jgi:citrate synthase
MNEPHSKQTAAPAIAHGLRGVLAAETRLSMVDGNAGRLVIAGLPLEELAPNATYEEALHLLLEGHLPDEHELHALRSTIAGLRDLPDLTTTALREAARRRLPTMDALRIALDTLALEDDDPNDTSPAADRRRAHRLVAAAPVIVATYRRLADGHEVVPPRTDLAHTANFLYMLNGDEPTPERTRALETYLVTVIDHGMNNSTFTARTIASTRSDVLSAVVGAVGSLKGPLHGGAPGPAIDMVFEIRRRAARNGRSVPDEAEAWTREALERGERLMGFGHRMYRVRDPRADVLANAADALYRAGDTSLLDDAKAVERVILQLLEEHKPGRRIQTNVEFYTALLLHGVGLEADAFPAVFAIGRIGGWTAHVLEQRQQDELIRPDSHYTGSTDGTWQPVHERTPSRAAPDAPDRPGGPSTQ